VEKMVPEIKPNEYYVALDLGSETMAAYYQERYASKGKMINLQYYASKLLGDEDVDYVKENGKISPRLRTRISLEDNRQPEILPDEHANLDFINNALDYKKSLFSYFQKRMQSASQKFLPNPKLPFQEGGYSIIPEVISSEGIKTRYNPEKLIQHLTAQIIKNFILQSVELKNIPSDSIHLTLTMPNVYSLAHIESIREFIKKSFNLASVNCLYESDAVAYFIMDTITGEDKKTKIGSIKEFISDCFKKYNKVKIVTIDIGKGTTDLSLIQITEPTVDPVRQHFVLARTGRSSGGNQLNYIFAKYYNKLLKKMDIKFDFLNLMDNSWEQYCALRDLEILIEQVKTSIDENYQITMTPDKQKELITKLADKVFEMIDPNFKKIDRQIEKYELFVENLILPSSFPKSRRRFIFKKDKFADEALLELRNDIKEYVRINCDDIIDRLIDMAINQQKDKNNKSKSFKNIKEKVFDKRFTIALIAGQASQFKPLRRAINSKLEALDFSEKQYIFLENNIAKEACCKGAVNYQRAMPRHVDQYEIHGTYGFLPAVNCSEGFKAVDLKYHNEVVVEFKITQQYWFVFCPRVFLKKEDKPGLKVEEKPTLNDGSTALLYNFKGKRFKVKYDIDKGKILVADSSNLNDINPIQYEETKLANFGDVNESIFRKVWPEILATGEE
jgi:hypothetical protein